MITIQDVLNADVFQNYNVLAGENGLLREVTTITIAEVPDAAKWLRGGELVCSTAFFISNTGLEQSEWVESLIINGASALAIKTSRFLGVLPKSIIECANNHNFPIIELDHEVTWPAIIESFMDYVTNQRIKIMQLIEDVQRDLINLVLENNTIQTLVNKISELVGNTIIIEDAKLNVIAVSNVEGDIQSNLDSPVFKARINEHFRQNVLKSNFYKAVKMGEKKEHLEINLTIPHSEKIRNYMFPIFSNKTIYGFISLLESQQIYSSTDLMVLKNSSTAIALQLMKQYLNQQTYRKKNLALIEDIIHGRIHTQIVFEYDFLNINLANPMVAVLMDYAEPNLENNYFWERSEDLITMTIRKHLYKHFNQVIIGNNGSLFTLLVSFQPNQIEKVNSLVKEAVEHALAELAKQFGEDKFSIGIGGAYPQPELVEKSFKEAKTALSVAKKCKIRRGNVLLFEEIGIHRIIFMVQDTAKIREFCDDLLLELKKYDEKNSDVLLETLHEFLLCDCVVKETAKKMFVHPNTVTYRIKKIKQLLKHDLALPEFKMAYLFALEANDFLKELF
ncbi:transcriptional regulator, PucR family [Desulfitobacterium hafniense DCB-2]|uniref:Purine catabolism regulatory protein-like family protein n=2 Tax=Desulfitobacterium hafniense TaxID=49338 RepID=G9XIL6_DESHA|nr:PucR family transcriptional regulator [Desulfitobacterium hafniense]ACL19847.1 transcriptional regulator, PucR family [Desulfitobacterium hafniense DCB-2]EHL08480.1 purine catabolism regulatory protein-like family protein [Desulfitobacterium hafniense DP7]